MNEKIYVVEVSESANSDLENIISYIKHDLKENIIADKYKILFKQAIKRLEDVAGSMPILNQEITGHRNIRKLNVRKYIIFYIVDDENNKVFVVRIGHTLMDWENLLK